MTRYVYDEAASKRFHMDVVHLEDDRIPWTPQLWAESCRRLNVITDPLIRAIVELHQDCGSGDGQCDSDEDADPEADWGCDTLSVIANHFGIEYPAEDAT